MIVADASVLFALLVPGFDTASVTRGSLAGEELAAPDFARVEVLSALRRQTGRGLLTAERGGRAIVDLIAMPITMYSTDRLFQRCWELRDNLTAYDACYIALAEALDVRFVTADAKLAAAPGLRCDVELLRAHK